MSRPVATTSSPSSGLNAAAGTSLARDGFDGRAGILQREIAMAGASGALEAGDLAAHAHVLEFVLHRAPQRERKLGDGIFGDVGCGLAHADALLTRSGPALQAGGSPCSLRLQEPAPFRRKRSLGRRAGRGGCGAAGELSPERAAAQGRQRDSPLQRARRRVARADRRGRTESLCTRGRREAARADAPPRPPLPLRAAQARAARLHGAEGRRDGRRPALGRCSPNSRRSAA